MKNHILAFAAFFAVAACTGNRTETTQHDPEDETPIVELTHEDSLNSVIELNNDNKYRPGQRPTIPTIIDFNATWCGPCKAFKPVFNEAAARYPEIRFVSCDVDKMRQTADAFGIHSIPTLIFIDPNGTEKKFVGLDDIYPDEKFDALIQSIFKP